MTTAPESDVKQRIEAGNFGIIPPEIGQKYTGLEIFQKLLTGEFPGALIGKTLGFIIDAVEEGSVTFIGDPDMSVYNPIGTVHGGYAATLLDSCMACAIHTTLGRGAGYTTLELSVRYTRAMTVETGPVRAIGRVETVGRRAGTATGQLLDRDGRILAHGSTTCMIFPAKG